MEDLSCFGKVLDLWRIEDNYYIGKTEYIGARCGICVGVVNIMISRSSFFDCTNGLLMMLLTDKTYLNKIFKIDKE